MKTSFTLIGSVLIAMLAGALYGHPQAASIGPSISANPPATATRVLGGVHTIDVDGRLMTGTDVWPSDCDAKQSNFLSCLLDEARNRWPIQPTLDTPILTKLDRTWGFGRATALRFVCHALKTVGQRVAFK